MGFPGKGVVSLGEGPGGGVGNSVRADRAPSASRTGPPGRTRRTATTAPERRPQGDLSPARNPVPALPGPFPKLTPARCLPSPSTVGRLDHLVRGHGGCRRASRRRCAVRQSGHMNMAHGGLRPGSGSPARSIAGDYPGSALYGLPVVHHMPARRWIITATPACRPAG